MLREKTKIVLIVNHESFPLAALRALRDHLLGRAGVPEPFFPVSGALPAFHEPPVSDCGGIPQWGRLPHRQPHEQRGLFAHGQLAGEPRGHGEQPGSARVSAGHHLSGLKGGAHPLGLPSPLWRKEEILATEAQRVGS